MIIKKDRVPLKFLIFAQHSKGRVNRFSTHDILRFFRDNPVYIGTMLGIGKSVPERRIRSFLRGLPGNISMVLNATGLVKGADDYYYKLPDVLFHAIKRGALRFKQREDDNFETVFTNTEGLSGKDFGNYTKRIEKALDIFLDRKTQEVKLRDYGRNWREREVIKEIKATGRRITQRFFEQRKAYFETDREEYLYLPHPTIPFKEMLKPRPRVYYSITKSLQYHPDCPNFVFKTLNEDLSYKDFYTIPFRIIDKLVFQKLKPDSADVFYLCIKERNDQEWLYFRDNRPLLSLVGYEKTNRIEDISKAPYTAPHQRARLEQYRKRLHSFATSTFEDKIKVIKKYKEANQEINVIPYVENLSLAKALKVKQGRTEKTIFVVRVDTAYPDLLCIYLEDLTEEERFGKSVKSLDLLDLFLIRHNVIHKIDDYKSRLFEIEAEYDAFEFAHHESPKDDVTRSRFITAWISHYPDDTYITKKKVRIPIINVQKLWSNLVKELQTQKGYASQ